MEHIEKEHSMSTQLPLSVIVHTKNSAKTIRKCLLSVKMAEEIVVVDMHSTDKTKDIALRYTDEFFEVKDSGYVETVRNFGIGKATQDWILLLDADEELSDGMQNWLQAFFPQPDNVVAYYIPRRNFMFGQEVQHTGWWPDYQLRLFKKGSVQWQSGIHSQPQITGEAQKLDPSKERCIIHHNYPDVSSFVERMNRYTSITAQQHSLAKPVTAQTLMSAFSDDFLRRLFEWEGIKDGGLGVGLSLMQATYQLLIQMKLWENNEFKRKKESQADSIEALQMFHKDLTYWITDWKVKNSKGFAKILWMIRRKRRW